MTKTCDVAEPYDSIGYDELYSLEEVRIILGAASSPNGKYNHAAAISFTTDEVKEYITLIDNDFGNGDL